MKKIGILASYTAMKTPQMQQCDYLHYYAMIASIGEEQFLPNSVSIKEFFDKVEQTNTIPKTSQLSTEELMNILRDLDQKYDFIFVIGINKVMSGIYQNLSLAIKELGIEAKTYLIDSESITLSETVLIQSIINDVNNNLSIPEIINNLEYHRHHCKTLLFPGSFKYLKHSGRINGLQCFVGSALNMRIFLEVLNGKANVIGKGRGINSTLKIIEKIAQENGYNKVLYGSGLVDPKVDTQVMDFLQQLNLDPIECVTDDFAAIVHFGPNTYGVCLYKEGE